MLDQINKGRAYFIAVILGLLACLLVQPRPSPAAPTSLKVGVIAPLSGGFAPFGTKIRDGIEFARGPHTEIIFEDSKFETKTALSAYRKLVAVDRVNYLISAGGETCHVLNEHAQRDRIIHIAVGCNTAEFRNSDSYNFRVDVNEAIAAQKLAEYLSRKGVKKIGLLNIENTWGSTVTRFTESALRMAGIRVAAHMTFAPETAGNLRSELARLKNEAPDRLFIVSSAETFALVLKQLEELKIAIPVVSTISVESPDFLRLAGSLAEGIIYLSVSESPKSRKEHPGFFDRFPPGSTFAAWGYDAVKMLQTAHSHPNPRSYLKSLKEFVGAFNSYKFSETGELELHYEVRQIRNGKFMSIEGLNS